jgi:hypothetical protein
MRIALLLVGGLAWAQAPMAFEVATVKPSPPQEFGTSARGWIGTTSGSTSPT